MMKSNMARITLAFFLFLLSFVNFAFAEIKTFVKEYTYQASEADSKQTSRILAMEQVKRLLVEELGTYLESETIVKDFQMTSDEIRILTAGIVSTRVLEEKWDGKQYWLKAEISSDPEEVARSIDIMRNDRQKMKDIKSASDKLEIALKDIEQLKKELKQSKSKSQKIKIKKEYGNQANKMVAFEWRMKGGRYLTEAITTGNYGYYQKSIDAYKKVISLEPEDEFSYLICASNYSLLKQYDQAVNILNQLIKRNQKSTKAYLYRGSAYYSMGNINRALKDYDVVIKLDPDESIVFSYKGMAYFDKRDYVKAINELTIAINMAEKKINQNNSKPVSVELIPINDEEYENAGKENETIVYEATPVDETTDEFVLKLQLTSDYGLRGRAYYLTGNKKLAINDLSKAIELLPRARGNDLIYYLRCEINFQNMPSLGDRTLSSYYQSFLFPDINMAIELNPSNSAYYDFRSALYTYYKLCLLKENYDNTGLFYEQVEQKAQYDKNSADFVQLINNITNQAEVDAKIADDLKKLR
ncbi:MAG: tetratricopeptide repeat protein [Bacilli bacterium]|nr:tetratricopeptide repeat protein [Bacilli bacterium]